MRTRAQLLGHPIHPMLIVLPLGALMLSVLLDFFRLVDDRDLWADTAYVLVALGVLTGLGVAIPGLMDWLSIPSDHDAKSIGLIHGASNSIGLVLFAVSGLLRYNQADNWSSLAMLLSLAGLAALLVGGWLGGEMVYRHGIGVDPASITFAPKRPGK